MRKFSIILLLCIFCLVGCATTESISVDSFQLIIEVPNASANELYIKAIQWAVSTSNNAESVIGFSDNENGIVTGKYVERFYNVGLFSSWLDVTTIITIEVKDGKIRVTMDAGSFEYLTANGDQSFARPIRESVKEKLDLSWMNLATSLTNAISAETVDW